MPETPETPETAKTRAEFQMLTDFLLRLADRLTLVERQVLELRQHAHIGEFAEGQDDEGERGNG
jgi:hypothetical protein